MPRDDARDPLHHHAVEFRVQPEQLRLQFYVYLVGMKQLILELHEDDDSPDYAPGEHASLQFPSDHDGLELQLPPDGPAEQAGPNDRARLRQRPAHLQLLARPDVYLEALDA